jgi:hypothetical protein
MASPSHSYVYAIVDRAAALPQHLIGLYDEPLTMVQWQELAAVVSTIFEPDIRPLAALLLRHEAVVEEIRRATPALPVRFGTILPGAAALAQSLADHYDVLLADLSRLGDKQEVSVTIRWDRVELSTDTNGESNSVLNDSRVEEDAGGRGTRYLLARRKVYQRTLVARESARAIASELDAHLRPYICESRHVIHADPHTALRTAYLLKPGALATIRDALENFQENHSALRLLVTGPWPPYSFVTVASKPAQVQESL